MSDLSILILNTNRKTDTLRCLDSIVNQDFNSIDVDVVVIDNNSVDGSVDSINRLFPNVNVIHTDVDKGYAGNNNFGFFKSSKDSAFTLILNEDTYFIDGSIKILFDFMRCNPNVGICGPLVLNQSNPNSIQSNGGWIDSNCVSGFHDHLCAIDCIKTEPHEVDWVSGCALMVKSELFQKLNGFWEPFYYTWEEVDLCTRVQSEGFKCCVVPKAKIVHRDCPSRPSDNAWYYAVRNRLLYIKRNSTCFIYVRTVLGMIVRESIRLLLPNRKSNKYVWDALIDVFSSRLGKRRVNKP